MAEESQAQADIQIPQTAVGETVEQPLQVAETVPAPGENTTQTPETVVPPEERISAADVEGYKKLKEQALSNAPVEQEQSVPVVEEVAPVEVQPPATQAVEGLEPNEEEADGKIPERIRLKGLPEKDRALLVAATLLTKSEGISISEAMDRVSGRGRVETPAAEVQTQPEVRSPDQIKADIAAAREEKRTAARDLDTMKMLDLDDRIETLRDELSQVSQVQAEAASRAQSQFSREVAEHQTKAAELYPDAAKEGTPLFIEMNRIADQLEAQGNDLVYQANAPLKIAQMAANNLSIAPATPRAKPKTQQPSPSTALKPAPVVRQSALGRPTEPAFSPAPGSARTTAPSGQPEIAVDKIRSVFDYEKIKRELVNTR